MFIAGQGTFGGSGYCSGGNFLLACLNVVSLAAVFSVVSNAPREEKPCATTLKTAARETSLNVHFLERLCSVS